jgi:hypothetical protein
VRQPRPQNVRLNQTITQQVVVPVQSFTQVVRLDHQITVVTLMILVVEILVGLVLAVAGILVDTQVVHHHQILVVHPLVVHHVEAAAVGAVINQNYFWLFQIFFVHLLIKISHDETQTKVDECNNFCTLYSRITKK